MTGSRAPGGRRLVLASGNRHKLLEASRILGPFDLEIVAAGVLGPMPEVAEDGATFAENAVQKARAVWTRYGAPTLADDSGLEVDGLGGAPGVRSARYAGEGASDAENNRRLLAELERLGLGPESPQRSARFVCVAALVNCAGDVETFRGTCPGRIAPAPAGKGGFGYDPLFVPDGYDRTFGELGPEAKDAISHRARALAAMAAFLGERPGWLGAG